MIQSESLISFTKTFEGTPVVQCWQMQNNSSAATEHKVLPSTYLHLVFPITGQITVSGMTKPIGAPFLAPILSCFKTIKIEADSTIFGVHIQPYFCSELFGCSPSELIRNAHLIADVFTPDKIYLLRDAVMIPQNFDQRVNSVIDFFDGLFRHNFHTKRNALSNFIKLMNFDPACPPGKAARDIGYSSRWIQKIHKEIIGVSPGEMTRIIRFNKFINKLNTFKDQVTQLALDSGYYDQAHAIKEFKRLGGITPGHFARTQPSIARILNYEER